MSGLTALTANYTDSEDEAESGNESTQKSPRNNAPPDLLGSLKQLGSPSSMDSAGRPPSSAKSTPTKRMGLVSYGADDDGGGDVSFNESGETAAGPDDTRHMKHDNAGEESDKNKPGSGSDMDLDTGEEEDEADKETESEKDKKQQNLQSQVSSAGPQVDAWDCGSQLPPEPEGLCNPRLQKHVNEMWNRQKERAYDMNAVIQSKKSFRNPSIYEKLIQHCGIDEHGTNFPKDLYDGHLFGEESYYDQLAKAQNEMEKKDQKVREQRMKEATSRAEAALASHAPKRKSRFDQGQSGTGGDRSGSGSSAAAPSANVAAAQARAASVAANLKVTLAASQSAVAKTIPAFGLLKKQ